jgi:hypothetical protein
MIHIKLDHMLREAVATPYHDLVTRATGAAVRTSIEQAIADTNSATTLLDFSEVGLVDFSCADEVVAKLLLETGPEADRYFVLQGLSEDHSEAIEHVLSHHCLVVLTVDPETASPTVLGPLNPDLRVALESAHHLGPGDAGELAEALGWTLDRTADALQTLALLRLVQAYGGRYHPIPLQ